MVIRTVIIDDEPAIINGLQNMLSCECPQVEVIATATSVVKAKQILLTKAVDLVFLDIKLGESNGFKLLRDLIYIEFQVVFITAHDQYAVEAFRFSALDFLLKPIDPDDLQKSIVKAEKALYKENLQLRIDNLLRLQQEPGEKQTIVLRTAEAYHVVRIKDIIQCEAKGNYTLFHLQGKSDILVSQTLKIYDELLSGLGFFRCHQSHLVNIDFITRYEKRDGGALRLENNLTIPVSPKKKQQLFDLLRL